MTFETYAAEWFDRRDFFGNAWKENRRVLKMYILPVIGSLELKDIDEKHIDEIFLNERLVHKQKKFADLVFRILSSIFDELMDRRLILKDPVLHIYDPVILINEKTILEGQVDVALTCRSSFSIVSCMWLKQRHYKPVTYNLYCHFLTHFIHPFIGRKPIGLVDHNNIRRVYTYFNTVTPNETWVGQIHLVMRMVFDYALEMNLIRTDPMLKISDPHLKPCIELDREKKNAVRAVFNKYGIRSSRSVRLSQELFRIMSTNDEYQNRSGIPKDTITFGEVYERWFAYTREGVLAANTARSAASSMRTYILPNIGSKPIQEVSPADLSAIMNVFALMGHDNDYYITSKLRSLFDYAVTKGYVSKNIAADMKSSEGKGAEKYILSDEEIRIFLNICNEADSVYGCLLGFLLCTGLRISEGLAVSFKNLDPELNTLKITNQIHNKRLIEATKTRRGRKIRLSGAAVFFLDKAKGIQQTFAQDPYYCNEYGLIFTAEDGSPLSRSIVIKNIYNI